MIDKKLILLSTFLTLLSFNTIASEIWLECGKAKKPFDGYPALLVHIMNIEKGEVKGSTKVRVLKVYGVNNFRTGMSVETFDASYDLKSLHFTYKDLHTEEKLRIDRQTLKVRWINEYGGTYFTIDCIISNKTRIENLGDEVQAIQFEKNRI
tara:strand:+ start:28 stop:483 length:456 start_codon:yes stop_codon:yes gene_type:complete